MELTALAGHHWEGTQHTWPRAETRHLARYHFVTDIYVAASRERAWQVLSDPSPWPSWWRWLRQVDVIDEGDQDGVGARHRLSFATALPYALSFETQTIRTVRPSLVETPAQGELAGAGLWELFETRPGTLVRYTWIVDPTKRWMKLLAPVVRPAFSWNHDVLMRDFARAGSPGPWGLRWCRSTTVRLP